MAGNPLGEYLRARRELVDPASVGLRVTGVRRTPGLRREEVATLAGVSADYYLRLEQGRDRNPSRQVLEALAGVLGLDAAATDHLIGLATARPSRSVQRARTRPETVPAGILQLLATVGLPAFVESRDYQVLACNELATALSPAIAPGANRLLSIFLDPAERALYPDWEQATAGLVGSFRAINGTEVEDPRIVRLVGELSMSSERFRQLWARHDVRAIAGGRVVLDHPGVGLLELDRQKLPVGETDGQLLVVYSAEPGSVSAERLSRLLVEPAAVDVVDEAADEHR
jgi:transcriptional regulator with XRE-family HTH domain